MLVPLLLVVVVLALICVLLMMLHRRVRSGSSLPDGHWRSWGVRTAATTRSPAAWEAAHRAILPLVTATAALAGIGSVAAVGVLVVSGVDAGFTVGVVAAALVLAMAGVATVHADVVARRTNPAGTAA